jgi:hypothetical protein
MTTTPSTSSTRALQAVSATHPGDTPTSAGRRAGRTLSAHTLLWYWIALHSWSQNAVRAALERATVPAHERERGEALSSAAIAVGMVIIAGIIVAALKTKSQTIVSNVCTNADPSSC